MAVSSYRLLSSRTKIVICVGDVLPRHSLAPYARTVCARGKCNVPVGAREHRLHFIFQVFINARGSLTTCRHRRDDQVWTGHTISTGEHAITRGRASPRAD